MPRNNLQDLLPSSLLSNQSRSEMLQQVVTATAGPAASSGLAGTNNSVDSLSSALQGPVKDVTEQVSALAAQISSLSSNQQTLISATQDNTQAVTQNTSTKGSGGSSFASTVGSIASSLFGGGLGLSPIVSGLLDLFGGGGTQTMTALTPFMLPASVQYNGGLSTGPMGPAVQPVSYGQTGEPRTQGTTAPQVTIQVNALDSQSFLDHSDEIAQAVKQAMLSSNSLNDVISDL
jgi:hypothetical protein